MNRSFYHFALKYREPVPRTDEGIFANAMYDDLDFPKMEEDYHKLSDYIELTDAYNDKVSIFDALFEEYKIVIKKELS